MSKAGENIRVYVRIRPISSKEKQDGRIIVTTANRQRKEVVVHNPKTDANEPPKTFTFDSVFPDDAHQQEVYDVVATDIVESVMNGFNGTIFAYGQTGSGKTHSMEGFPDPPELRGIIPNSFKHIFDKVAVSENKQYLVRASYLEIYNEEIRDLLAKDPANRLDLKENADSGVYVKDLTSFVVKSAAEIDQVMQAGKKNRSVGATLMNQQSSRSHSIFSIVVECQSKGLDGNEHICVGKLNLVDLAGSERQSKTGATGDRLKEATKINLSLSALGNVISALVDGKSQHIPYRDSKLTRLLQDSLGGNTKTAMIANCGPADYNYDETVTTLRYANRAKNIKNKPKINEDPKDAMLREFQEEIQRLRQQLQEQGEGGPGVSGGAVGGVLEAPEVEIQEVEKIVEKVIVEKGLSEEQIKAMTDKTEAEKEELRKEAAEEKKKIMQEKLKHEMARVELEARLKAQKEEQERLNKEREALGRKLKVMEDKLVKGGEVIEMANKQEEELERTRVALEEKRRQELILARQLAEQEEANQLLEENYSSLQEEAEKKTIKLKKQFQKWKAAQTEARDLRDAFEQEKEDLVDTIRQLTKQLGFKQLIVDNFMPRDVAARIERLAIWQEQEDNWKIPKLELAGNNMRKQSLGLSSSKQKNSKRTEKGSEKENRLKNVVLYVPPILSNPYLIYLADEDGTGYAPAKDADSSTTVTVRYKKASASSKAGSGGKSKAAKAVGAK